VGRNSSLRRFMLSLGTSVVEVCHVMKRIIMTTIFRDKRPINNNLVDSNPLGSQLVLCLCDVLGEKSIISQMIMRRITGEKPRSGC
jgi:hypothetical protein